MEPFGAPWHLSSVWGDNIRAVAVGDSNGDGSPAIAVADGSVGTVTMGLGNGDGTFQAGPTLSTGQNPISMTAADFNGDGNLDLAVLDCATCVNAAGADSIYVFPGNGDGTIQTPTVYPIGSAGAGTFSGKVITLDFNGDGHLDLGVATQGGGTILFPGRGTGRFSRVSLWAPQRRRLSRPI